MALFGIKTKKSAESGSSSGGNTEEKVTQRTPEKVAVSTPGLSHVLLHARITEKATDKQAESVYTFDIAVSATKRDVLKAIKALYRVSPRTVHVVTVPRKSIHNRRTGRVGFRAAGKKACVYLKKGETITVS